MHVAYEACGFGYEIAWFLRGRGVEDGRGFIVIRDLEALTAAVENG